MKHILQQDVRWYGIFRRSSPVHLYLLQFTTFTYMLYRLISRDYRVYGLIPEKMFDYQREFIIELYPIPLTYFTSFQWIYAIFPRPSYEFIGYIQYSIILMCICGIIGIYPRIMAIVTLFAGLHLSGMMHATNSETDGETLILCSLLILSLVPNAYLYTLWHRDNIHTRNEHYHWPIFLFFVVVGSFYTISGINKIIEVGPHWPFVLRLDNLAIYGIEQSLFASSRYVNPWFSNLLSSPILSVLSGIIAFIGEIGFISILFLPRYRLFFVSSMIALHISILLMTGINFVGSSLLLMMCFDWNALFRRLYITTCIKLPETTRLVEICTKYCMYNSVIISSETTEEDIKEKSFITVIDDYGEVYTNFAAIDQIMVRVPIFWPISLINRIPGMIFVCSMLFQRHVITNNMHSNR